jgi:hypothetical protein
MLDRPPPSRVRTEVNIGKLLISGIIPAILVTITIMATIYFLVWQEPSRAPRACPRRLRSSDGLTQLKRYGHSLKRRILDNGVGGKRQPAVPSPLAATGAAAHRHSANPRISTTTCNPRSH